MKKTVLFLFLVMFSPTGFSSDYSNTPAEGRKGSWAWTKNAAASGLGNGIVLVVMFSTADRCKTAKFAILGNDEIDSIQLNIDGKKFSSMVTPDTSILSDGIGIVDYKLTRSALRELKNGSSLTVETNKGPLVTSLSGSALSFNMAYENCIKTIPGISGGESRQAPSTKDVQTQRQQSANAQRFYDQSNRSRERIERQRASNLAYRKSMYEKRRGLSALPGKHGLARESKNELKALDLDQMQRNLDR